MKYKFNQRDEQITKDFMNLLRELDPQMDLAELLEHMNRMLEVLGWQIQAVERDPATGLINGLFVVDFEDK